MIKTFFTLLMICTMSISAMALPSANEVVVEGEPEITWQIIDSHIRLMEFVLQTRLTLRQKEAFLAAIKQEAAVMDEEARENFVQAQQLADNLNYLDHNQREQVREILAANFAESAKVSQDDPAAALYTYLANDANNPVIEIGEDVVTRQSAEALIEYLAFLGSTENPLAYTQEQRQEIMQLLVDNFSELGEDERLILDDFQLYWFMVRAAWQNAPDMTTRVAWRKNFATCGIAPGKVPNIAQIKRALSTDIYADLLDIAAIYGVEPIEWFVWPEFRIW